MGPKLQDILQLVSHKARLASPQPVCDCLMQFLAEQLGGMALVGSLNDENTRICSHAFFEGNRKKNDLSFNISGSPFELLLDQEGVLFQKNTGVLFPGQEYLDGSTQSGFAGTALRNSKGMIIGFLGILFPPYDGTDLESILQVASITCAYELERIQSEERLRKSNAFLSQTNEIAKIGGWELDVQSGEVEWTRETYRIHEVDPETKISVDRAISFYAEEAKPIITNAVKMAMEAGIPFDLELPMRTEKGRAIWAHAQGQVIVRDGEVIKVVGTFQDITESKKTQEAQRVLERQLHQSQKLESIGLLTGGIAHDFNNNLNVIIGNAEMALEEPDLDEDLQENLTDILDAALNSSGLTRQLLGFSRQQPIAPESLDLNAFIDKSLKVIRRVIGESIELDWRPSNSPCHILFDQAQLNQVLMNLAINSRDAIEGPGKIRVSVSTVSMIPDNTPSSQTLEPGDYAQIVFSDNGKGMSLDLQNRIFDPFFTTKERGKGTGLGLSTVYGIVQQNRGFIEIESEVGAGTTFKLSFKRVTSNEASRIISSKLSNGQPSRRILVIEDDPGILKVVDQMLRRMGFTTDLAGSPSEAIAKADSAGAHWDLFLSDVVMPEMNGLELWARLKSRFPNAKWLFMSGYAEKSLSVRMNVGSDLNLIIKPFTRNELVEKIQALLSLDIIQYEPDY